MAKLLDLQTITMASLHLDVIQNINCNFKKMISLKVFKQVTTLSDFLSS